MIGVLYAAASGAHVTLKFVYEQKDRAALEVYMNLRLRADGRSHQPYVCVRT